MIHSLAGELGLDVYVISLSRTGLDDSALSELTSELPERCIALMEDIDAAFQGLENRNLEDPSTTTLPVSSATPGAVNNQAQPPAQPAAGANGGPRPPPVSRITLSGLLNAIDGIGAHDGRILYATTNRYSALDPALSRPGRMDLHVEFKLASRYQARELFRCFYLPGQDIVDEDEDGMDEAEGESGVKDEGNVTDSGYSSRTGTPERGLIDLTPTEEKAAILPASAPESPPLPVPSEKNKNLPPPVYSGNSHRARAPQLTRRQVSELATAFATSLPEEREFSMAALQGYLMAYKTRPYEAAKDIVQWVEKERSDKAAKMKARGTQVETRTANVPAAETKVAQPVAT
jgi:mitochondrial chaperone BCS1